MRYTEQELWDIVNGADTREKIADAEKLITGLNIDIDLYDELMNALAYLSRELYREGR